MAKVKKTLPIANHERSEIPAQEKAERRKWEVEEAVRTMQRAEEIRKDKAMMKDVKAMAKQKMAELKKIC
jgi:hypothetical protein